jgi:hypothetical protein
MFKGERESGVHVEQEGHPSIYAEASRATQRFFEGNFLFIDEALETSQYSSEEAESLLEQARLFGIKIERGELFDPGEEASREEELGCLAQLAVAKFVRQQNPLLVQEEKVRVEIIKQRLEACGFPRNRSVSRSLAWFNSNLRGPLFIFFWKIESKRGRLLQT